MSLQRTAFHKFETDCRLEFNICSTEKNVLVLRFVSLQLAHKECVATGRWAVPAADDVNVPMAFVCCESVATAL